MHSYIFKKLLYKEYLKVLIYTLAMRLWNKLLL